MRLIDGEKLIEKIEEWQSKLTRKDAEESAIDDALEWVNDRIAEADALGWIPVSEGLPNDYDTVLATVKCDDGTTYVDDVTLVYDDVCEKGYFMDNGEDITDMVTAWMRLPEPWEGEEE